MPKNIIDRLNRTHVEALWVDLKAGLTRAMIASQAPRRSAKRLRNQREARKAYDSITSFIKKVMLTSTQAETLNDGLAKLKSALEELGESF